jgi:lysophospholipase L1-like esterase
MVPSRDMVESRRSSLASLIAANAIALLIFSIAAAGILELFCRTVLDNGMRYEFEMWRYATELKVPSADPNISFAHRPNSRARIMGADVSINELGLRDDRAIAPGRAAGTTRILMLGDSVTFGFGVSVAETTSRRLESQLNAGGSGTRFEVLNSGVGNYNTAMEVAYYLRDGRRLDPDIVVLNFFVNDAEPTPAPAGNLLTRHSLAAVYVNNRLDSVSRWANGAPGWEKYYEGLFAEQQPGWQKAQAAIRALKEACDQQGAPLVLVNYPDLHQTNPYPLWSINRSIESVARRLAIPYLDLTPAVAGDPNPSQLWVNASDPHPNGRTHARYAQMMGTWVMNTVLPKMTPRSAPVD